MKKSAHIRIISAVIDTWFGIKGREIFLPDTNEDVQFSLRDNGRAIGILRVETEEQFNELFDSIKTLSFYTDFERKNLEQAEKAYEEAWTLAWKALDEADAQAEKVFDESWAPFVWAGKEPNDATAQVQAQVVKVYKEARAQAKKVFDEAIAPTGKALHEARAQAKKAKEEAERP